MHVSQCPAARALLLDTRCPCGFSQHPALGNEHNVTFREFFLELPRKPGIRNLSGFPKYPSCNGNPDSPGLNLMEGLELRDGDKDDDGLLATTDIDLPGSGDLQSVEFRLEIGNVVFKVDQSLGNLDFGLIRGRGRCIGSTGDFVLERHVET